MSKVKLMGKNINILKAYLVTKRDITGIYMSQRSHLSCYHHSSAEIKSH